MDDGDERTTRPVSISPPSLAQDPNLNAIREKASEPGSKYAFLVHSTDSLKNGEDPSIDNKPLARQKRRRTSPEDQAVLEASFLQNPKPDKAARMALVDRVALGEKEVQIWFQNRRQSTRRKQRPLEAHEIPALAYGANYSSPYSSTTPGTISKSTREDGAFIDDSPAARLPRGPRADGDVTTKDKEEAGAETDASAQKTDDQKASTSFSDLPAGSQSFFPPSSQESNSGRWLSSRRSAAPFRSFHESMSQVTESDSLPASQESNMDPPRHGPKKFISAIRLSFGADGSAILRNGDSPSPPRKLLPPPANPGEVIPGPKLHLTQSSASLVESGSQDSAKSQSLRRVSSFRSHDSRTWEFFCDRDVRGELEERAEQEQSGSAADAIKLARSNSGKVLRRSLSNKRTITPYAEVSSAKRVKIAAAAPVPATTSPTQEPTSTTTSPALHPHTTPYKENHSVQPLQPKSASARNPRRSLPSSQTPGHNKLSSSVQQHKTPKLKQTPTFEFPTTDSDKENWSPERHLHFINSMITSPAVPPTTTSKRNRSNIGAAANTPLRRGITPSKASVVGRGGVERSSGVGRRREKGSAAAVAAAAAAAAASRHEDHNAHEGDDTSENDEYDHEHGDDDEVTRFMSGSGRAGSRAASQSGGGHYERSGRKKSDSVSEEEDLDCVQGLLSLSQGAWR
ncbi:hypothetical protein AAFC00_004944 [Neodothiora populina]